MQEKPNEKRLKRLRIPRTAFAEMSGASLYYVGRFLDGLEDDIPFGLLRAMNETLTKLESIGSAK